MPAPLTPRPRLPPLLLALTAACTAGGGPPPADPPPEAEVPRAPVELLVQRTSRAGERSWYTMAPDGSRVLPFTGIPADAVAAVPSPDGRTLALLRATADDVHLWRMARDGTELQPLLLGLRVVHSVAWSPDGASLVVSQSTLTTDQDIWVLGADGTGLLNLTPDPLPAVVADRAPAFSPDGGRIAFTSNRSGGLRLWIMAADGSSPRQVLASDLAVTERDPTWSPDGRRLAFAATSAAGPGIGFSAPDGAGFELFPVPSLSGAPAWSPDGRIVFPSRAGGDEELIALDPASGATANLTRHRARDLGAVPLRHVAPAAWRGLTTPARVVAGTPGPVAIAAGDLVTGGRPELVVLAPSQRLARLLQADAGGAFQPFGGLDTAAGPLGLAVADLSRDGLADLAVLGPGGLQVYRGGAGGPDAPTDHPLTASGIALAVADLNDDGSPELLTVAARDGGPFRALVHEVGSFDGALTWVLDYPADLAGAAQACAADVTGEGAADLLVLTRDPRASVALLPGQGDVTFGAALAAATGLAVAADDQLACADLDGDRRADLVHLGSGGVSVLRSLGDRLAAPVPLQATGTSLALADLDRDGDPDLVVAGPGSPDAAYLRNLGDGSFARPAALRVGGAPSRVVAADLDGDLWPDVAVADEDGSVAVQWNLGGGAP